MRKIKVIATDDQGVILDSLTLHLEDQDDRILLTCSNEADIMADDRLWIGTAKT